MAKEPKSNIKNQRQKIRYVNGVVIGNTELGADELANLETVANLSADDLAALAESAEALEAIGTYEGATDIATDLATVYASVETASTGLLDRTTALETAVGTYAGAADIATDLASAKENVDSMLTVLLSNYSEDTTVGTTYVYSDTPTADVVAVVTAGSTAATITPGGATAWALTFTLPTASNSETNVFRVDYDLGTHTGTVTIGGVVVTGSGVLHFFWNGSAYVTWVTGAHTVTLSDNSAGILVRIEDGDAANAITVTLPTSVNNVSRTLVVAVSLTADAGTACTLNLAGYFLTAAGLSTNVTNVANGVYVLHGIDSGLWVPVACTAVTTN